MIAIRGAIQVRDNASASIMEATSGLLSELQRRNGFGPGQVVSAIFTMTPDLDRGFPARAARSVGWVDVPMIGAVETEVAGALKRVVRVLLHVETDRPPRHVYLEGAERLRPDLSEPDAPAPAGEPEFGPVLICGLGLIGGSIALALSRSGRVGPVIGHDADGRAMHYAMAAGAICEQTWRSHAVLDRVRIVVLAMPVAGILDWLELHGDLLRPGQVVMDVGGAKRRVVEAFERLPEGVEAIGTHPMAGSDRDGFSFARADLFTDACWALVESPRTGSEARRVVAAVVEATGAHPLVIDAERHDRAVAATSHLPYLLSCVLARGAEETAEPAVLSLSGRGFRDMTRLAGSAPGVMADVLVNNWDGVRAEVERFRDGLEDLLHELDAGMENGGVERVLGRAREARNRLAGRAPPG